MDQWIKCEIGDLCNTISETYRGNDEEVILINTSDVLDGKILNHKRVKNEKLKGQFKKTFLQDDILYSEIRPANRRFAYVDVQDTSLYIASTKLMVLRCNTDIVIPKFLFAILTSQTMIEELQLRAESRSGTFPQITFGAELSHIKVNIPDKETQLKIVSVLESFQQKLETNNKINRNLQQQLNSYFSYISENASDIYSISDYCDLGSSKRVFARDYKLYGVPFYRGKEISMKSNGQLPSDLLYISPEHYAELKKKSGAPQDGDILITAVGTIGNSYMVHNEEFYFKDGNIIWLKNFTSKEINYYIFDYMQSLQFKNDLAAITIGSTQQALTIISLSKMKIQVPSNQYLKEYYSFSKKIHDSIVANQAENSRLVEIRDTLLPKLMSGDLDVSDLDI